MSDKKRSLGDMDGYNSDFDEEEQDVQQAKKTRRQDITTIILPGTSKPHSSSNHHSTGLPTRNAFEEERRRADSFKNTYGPLNAFERHRKLISDYLCYHRSSSKSFIFARDSSKDKTDNDIVKENHRFIWKDDDQPDTWEKQMAKQYYDKLFKEYCICDLSMYKAKKIAMRWRTEAEVISGKGQFVCGEKKCTVGEGLRSWEVNFAYMEDSVKKNALVKIRLCSPCSVKLNMHQKRKEIVKPKRKRRSTQSTHDNNNSRSSTGHDTTSDPTDEEKAKAVEKELGAVSVWKEPVLLPDVKSRDEEFEEYFDDLFQ